MIQRYKYLNQILDEAIEALDLCDHEAAELIRARRYRGTASAGGTSRGKTKASTAAIPEIYSELPDTTFISASEMAAVFDCNRGSISKMVERETVPKPTMRTKGITGKRLWRLGEIRLFIAGTA